MIFLKLLGYKTKHDEKSVKMGHTDNLLLTTLLDYNISKTSNTL